MRRRCSSRHRRHRRIRRALLITLCALTVLSVSSVLLQRLSPSLFRASSHITEANTSEQAAQKTLDLFQQEARREMGRRRGACVVGRSDRVGTHDSLSSVLVRLQQTDSARNPELACGLCVCFAIGTPECHC